MGVSGNFPASIYFIFGCWDCCQRFAGWISHRYGSVAGTMLVLILTTLSAFFHIFFSVHLQLAFIIPAFVIFGMAWGFLNIAPVLAVTGIVDPKNTGVIMGALWTFLNLGASVGPAIMGMIFRSSSSFMTGFHLTAFWLTALSALAAISILFLLRRHKDTCFISG